MSEKAVPEPVKAFITQFHQTIKDQQVTQINQNYDNGWSKVTEKYYKQSEWPSASQIAPIVNDGTTQFFFSSSHKIRTFLPRLLVAVRSCSMRSCLTILKKRVVSP